MESTMVNIIMQIAWKILAKLGKMGLKWARKKVSNKIENELKIGTEGKLHFLESDHGLPPIVAILRFNVTNMSDFCLNPNLIVAWVINQSWRIGKICWFRQEIEGKDDTKERERLFGFVSNNRGFDIIPLELRPKSYDTYFDLYYPIPAGTDVKKIDGLGLDGIIEFSYDGINIVKRIKIGCKLVK